MFTLMSNNVQFTVKMISNQKCFFIYVHNNIRQPLEGKNSWHAACNNVKLITCRDQTSDQFHLVSMWRVARHGGTSMYVRSENYSVGVTSRKYFEHCILLSSNNMNGASLAKFFTIKWFLIADMIKNE